MKKAKIKSPSYFTEGTEAALIQGLYDGTSLSELMAPMLKRIVEAALSGELAAHLEEDRQAEVPIAATDFKARLSAASTGRSRSRPRGIATGVSSRS